MHDSMGFVVKLRGLPWDTTKNEIYNFLNDCNILNGERGIHIMIGHDGRPTGDGFVELVSMNDVDKAKAHDKQNLGKRYVEVFDSKPSEMQWFVSHMPGGNTGGGGGGGMSSHDADVFVRLRGLPFEVTKQDIAQFFSGIQIADYGITITMDQTGRPSGEGFVEFASSSEREKACERNKEKISHRYIEIFKCSRQDVKHVSQSNFGGGYSQLMGARPGPYDRPSGMGYGGGRGGRRGGGGGGVRSSDKDLKDCTTGHMILMRGLPFEAKQGDVYRFLAPIIPAEVRMLMVTDGDKTKPKGTCEVDFMTHSDAVAAMSKNRMMMGHRYIEMFLKSEPGHNDGWGNSGRNNSFQLW